MDNVLGFVVEDFHQLFGSLPVPVQVVGGELLCFGEIALQREVPECGSEHVDPITFSLQLLLLSSSERMPPLVWCHFGEQNNLLRDVPASQHL